MELEQKSPNKPNFGLIVMISAGTILLILLIALAAVRFDGKRLLNFHYRHADRSQLVLSSDVAEG